MGIVSEISGVIVLVASTLTTVLTLVEKSQKIKAKPLSKFFRGDLDKKIDELAENQKVLNNTMDINHKDLRNKISEVRKKVDMNDIDTIRTRILDSESLLRKGEQFTKTQWESLYKDIQKWNNYHKDYKDLNGFLKVAIENIDEMYKNAVYKD